MIPVPSRVCLELVEEFEGFRATAYRDSGKGIWTIGFGSTYRPDGTRVKEGDTISKEAAREWMAMDLAALSDALEKDMPGVTLNQHEADAVCCLVYNIGIGNFGRSAVKAALQRGDKAAAAEGFLSWRKSGGKVIDGLVRRRHTERAIFLGKTLEQAYKDGWGAIGGA